MRVALRKRWAVCPWACSARCRNVVDLETETPCALAPLGFLEKKEIVLVQFSEIRETGATYHQAGAYHAFYRYRAGYTRFAV